LFLAREMQKEFEDDRSLSREIVLEIGDVGEPLIPDSLTDAVLGELLLRQDFRVHAHDEHLFVIRTVENADTPALGQAFDIAPQEVVVEVAEILRSARLHV